MSELIAKLPDPYYKTEHGAAYLGDALELIKGVPDERINLIVTSPPFALNKKKPYGNEYDSQYVEWFKPFAREFWRILSECGSFHNAFDDRQGQSFSDKSSQLLPAAEGWYTNAIVSVSLDRNF